MGKQITYEEFLSLCTEYKLDPPEACALMLKESKATSFDAAGRPPILFERHYFREALIRYKGQAFANSVTKQFPDLCNAAATPAGGYGTYAYQWVRFDQVRNICREAAIEACSWGLGQVMGKHWKVLGYESPQDLLNCMFRSEKDQVEIIFRYLKVNNLIEDLNAERVKKVARWYNGPAYAKNQYDTKLADLIKQCKDLYNQGKLNQLKVFK
jgi:hypothetical protein